MTNNPCEINCYEYQKQNDDRAKSLRENVVRVMREIISLKSAGFT